jgi:hypothetical protein
MGSVDQAYSVVLTDPGTRPVWVMTVIRRLDRHISISAVKSLIQNAPATVFQSTFEEQAREAAEKLWAVGASVKVLKDDVELPERISVRMEFPDEQLTRLKGAGLSVSGPDPPGETCSCIRLGVCKPRAIAGNSKPGYEAWFGDGAREVTDAPTVLISGEYGRWVVRVHECIPGPGPGDFRHEHPRAEDAVTDVLDYYFGDPERVQPTEDECGPTLEEILAADKTDEPCRVVSCSDHRIRLSLFCAHHHVQMLNKQL